MKSIAVYCGALHGASPIFDEAARDGRIRAGQHVLMEAIGGGFTWGAVLAKW